MTVTADLTVETPAAQLLGWDALELWVGNARAVTQFLVSGFGFTCVAYAGPETGVADRCSYVLEQQDVRFVVTAGLDSHGAVWDHVRTHGDGFKALSFAVADVETVFRSALARGAEPVDLPARQTDGDGEIATASIRTYGDTVHRFTTRRHPRFAPQFTAERLVWSDVGEPVGLLTIDHVVANVAQGFLDPWVKFYESVLGFQQLTHFGRDQISTEFSALRSTVVTNGAAITMPINEPAEGRRKSQIQEYLDAYGGAGVQHVAFGTADIVGAVTELRRRGIRFLTPPPAYYEGARRRMDDLGADLPWADLAHLGILVDRESGGFLLQVFTEPLGDRPTLFFEVIERHDASGFGEGNFKALFEAIEAEQARRGHL